MPTESQLCVAFLAAVGVGLVSLWTSAQFGRLEQLVNVPPAAMVASFVLLLLATVRFGSVLTIKGAVLLLLFWILSVKKLSRQLEKIKAGES
jgi:Ca2+/H+ antiporter